MLPLFGGKRYTARSASKPEANSSKPCGKADKPRVLDELGAAAGSMEGTFLGSLVVTDVCSGWTEVLPLLAREQSLVAEGLDVMRQQLPVPVLGIDTDNDSVFIKETLVAYCSQHQLTFTRSRA